MRIPTMGVVALMIGGLLAACDSSRPTTPPPTPPPSHDVAVDSPDYQAPPLQDAIALGFAEDGPPQKASNLLPPPPQGLHTERYLPDWHNNNELHRYPPKSPLPGLPGLVLWIHHSSVTGATNRVHLVEFTQGESGGGLTPSKYRCTAPLLKQGVGLADFLDQLQYRKASLPTGVGQYNFVVLAVDLHSLCVRVE